MARGRFITFEGGEGAGKSTQVALLAEALRAAGLSVTTTREPGGSAGAEQIRSLLVEGATDRWDPMTEALLHFAARRDHLRSLIWPRLEAGDWVLSDRFADSTMAYQGYAQGVGRAPIERLYRDTIGDFAPELTLILDVSVDIGFSRKLASKTFDDRYLSFGKEFHRNVRNAFRQIAKDYPQRCVLIDGMHSIKMVSQRIWKVVARRGMVEL